MRWILRLILLGCWVGTAPAQDLSSHDRPIAIVGASVLPMDSERVLEAHTVLVLDGRIARVAPTATMELPPDAHVIDGAGRYVLPGLAEMHGHIPPPTAEADYIDQVLFLYVANGITTVRGMLGHAGQLALRDRANRGAGIVPTLYLAGPSFNGQSVSSPAAAEAMVRRQKREGWDLLKVHPGLTRDEYDAMARTAHAEAIRFGGHVPEEVGLMHALERGQETFDHMDGYARYVQGADGEVDRDRLAEAVVRTREAGAWIVPTMALWETLYGAADLEALVSYDELRYAPPSDVATWRERFERLRSRADYDAEAAERTIAHRMEILRALHEGGVRILLGTDAPQQFSVPGFSLHRELERMVAAGMTPYEILVAGSRSVGEYFGAEDHFGRVVEGMRADLLVLEADPFADVGHLQQRAGVMVRGRWLPEDYIQERLASIAAAHADQ